MKVSINTWNT